MHDAVAMAWGAPVKSANAASNSFTRGPWVRVVPASTSATADRSSSPIIGFPKGIIGAPRLAEGLHVDRGSGRRRAVDREAGGHHVEDLARRSPAARRSPVTASTNERIRWPFWTPG